MTQESTKKLYYEQPWLCRIHGFITTDKMLFFQHMGEVDHYQHGTNGTCEMCGKFLPAWNVQYRGLSEPTIILCEACKKIPNANKIIQDKRAGKYPLLESEKL